MSSCSLDAGVADGVGALEVEAAGFRTSYSVVLTVVVFFGASSLAFFMGAGAGLGGTYYRE